MLDCAVETPLDEVKKIVQLDTACLLGQLPHILQAHFLISLPLDHMVIHHLQSTRENQILFILGSTFRSVCLIVEEYHRL